MTNAIALLGLFLSYSDKITQIAMLLKTAHTEGRDVTPAEIDTLFANDDAVRAALDKLIAAASAPKGP